MNKDDLLRELGQIASWMDARFIIPGTNIRFGLDSLIGLVPGIGDTIGLGISGYIFHRAVQHGIPHHMKIRMLFNIFIDWVIGLIPLLGDLFDVKWKANTKNVELLRKHLEK